MDKEVRKGLISMRLPEEVLELLNKQAEKDSRTRTNVILVAIKTYLESVKNK